MPNGFWQVENRTKFIKYLNDSRIDTVIHYPNLISDNLAYKDHEQFGKKFLNASSYKDNLVSLPIFPGMNFEQKNYVVIHGGPWIWLKRLI